MLEGTGTIEIFYTKSYKYILF